MIIVAHMRHILQSEQPPACSFLSVAAIISVISLLSPLPTFIMLVSAFIMLVSAHRTV